MFCTQYQRAAVAVWESQPPLGVECAQKSHYWQSELWWCEQATL